MTIRTNYDEERYVYRKSKTSPPPLVSNHAVQRWADRGEHEHLSTLDAWHIGLPVEVLGDTADIDARLFCPSDVVLLGMPNGNEDTVIVTCKYREWLEAEGKTVTVDDYPTCETCGNHYRDGGKIIGCRWCQDGLVADTILDSYTPSQTIETWGR